MNKAEATQEPELRIQTEKTAYTAGECIVLQISLHNSGARPVKIPKYFMLPADDPNKNNLEIQVYEGSGKRLSRISHVMTGRALYYPELISLGPGETYQDSVQVAGRFAQGRDRKKVTLWNLGENPEITSVNEYPPVTRGTFKIQAFYHVNETHLTSLRESEKSGIWKGKLISNTIEVSIT